LPRVASAIRRVTLVTNRAPGVTLRTPRERLVTLGMCEARRMLSVTNGSLMRDVGKGKGFTSDGRHAPHRARDARNGRRLTKCSMPCARCWVPRTRAALSSADACCRDHSDHSHSMDEGANRRLFPCRPFSELAAVQNRRGGDVIAS